MLRLRNMELTISISAEFSSSRNIFLILIAFISLMVHVSATSYSVNETDRLSLLQFKNKISDDPNGVLKSWNDSLDHCQWQGVTCGARHKRVISITLTMMNIIGSISPHLGNLSFLKSVKLEGNRFHGVIPQEVGRLFRLRFINLSVNALTGNIPVNLSRCVDLRAIDFNGNALEGKIPIGLSSLKKLLELRLSVNNFTGEVPSFLGNLTTIQMLHFAFNNLEGSLPSEIGLLKNLAVLVVASNILTGTIPTSILNSTSLVVLSITENFFYGKPLAEIGLKRSNLRSIFVGRNQFTGIIPPSITNASKLERLDLGGNKFEGQVPINLRDLPSLRIFSIPFNHLGSNMAGDLSFIASLSNCSNLEVLVFAGNNFGGELPNSIANLTLQLGSLGMDGNKIFGNIAKGFGRYRNLHILGMVENYFSGTIPKDFGELQQLQVLGLSGNQLSGKVPSNLCNISSLYVLELRNNSFSGEINQCFGNCKNLQVLDISHNNLSGVVPPQLFSMHFSPLILDFSYNSFTGCIPFEVGKLVHMYIFNISYNKLSGNIPGTLGDCSSMEYLCMQGNYFKGSIPRELASLKDIQQLDLSQNNLTGQIPKDLESLRVLNYLNLSFNGLEGDIPIHGVFENASLVILVGNIKLCGGIPQLRFPPCFIHSKKKTKPLVIIIIFAVFSLLSFCLIMYYFKRHKRSESFNIPLELNTVRRISYHELHRATAGFSQDNLIGSGGFGFVYRGRLDQYANKVVAIKVLNLQKNGASKSFKAECKTLTNIRHRNIVPILTYCSSVDFVGQDFKAIVYKYVENGSLDMWLHKENGVQSTNLNLVQRLNIAVDVASALHYLHTYCGVVTVHCDLKPSNILLDSDLNALVADFGLARIFGKIVAGFSTQETSSSIAVKGTIGYAAPEYGIGGVASPEGDIYSFGILLLEMFSGRRPTDDIFADGLNLHNYVEMNVMRNVKNIADPILLSREGVEDVEKYIASLFRIGLQCSESSPNNRMDMKEALRELQSIKDAILGA